MVSDRKLAVNLAENLFYMMISPACFFQDLWCALPYIYVCLGVDVFEFIPPGVCWVSWIHRLFFIKFRILLPIISYSFCPFTSSFSGNPIELRLHGVTCVWGSVHFISLFFFFLFLRLDHLSWFIFKFDHFFSFCPAQICCLTLLVKYSWPFQLQNFNSLLFYNFSLFSETLFSYFVLVLRSWFSLVLWTHLKHWI